MEAVIDQKHCSKRTLWHSTQCSVDPTATVLEPRLKVLNSSLEYEYVANVLGLNLVWATKFIIGVIGEGDYHVNCGPISTTLSPKNFVCSIWKGLLKKEHKLSPSTSRYCMTLCKNLSLCLFKAEKALVPCIPINISSVVEL